MAQQTVQVFLEAEDGTFLLSEGSNKLYFELVDFGVSPIPTAPVIYTWTKPEKVPVSD